MGIIKRGVCGTCVWEVDDEMTLTIRPRDGKSGVMRSNRGWPRRNIRKVVIEKDVMANAYAGKMFAGMVDCTEFDVSGLDVSAVKDMKYMFACCDSLTSIKGAEKWDVSNVEDMSHMFEFCDSLTDISVLADWNVSGVKDMNHVFYDCRSLTDISPLAEWNVSRTINMLNMFGFCSLLTDISPLKKWDISNVTNTCCMFRGCESLTDISPLSGWDMSGIREKDGMFACTNINYDVLDAFIPMACPKEGSFIGYKKCRDERIVQLEVPEDAKRSSAYGKKCRCSRAKVLNIWTADGEEAGYAISCHDETFVYHKGKTVEVKDFNGSRFNECSSGIHFFMTREDAENYIL